LKIAVFSDVHGNYLNLLSFYESSLEMGIDKYICLGDLCDYYPDNKKVIDFVKEKKITCVLGNHDEFYLSSKPLSQEKKNAYNFDENLLETKSALDFLNNLPLKYELKVNNKSALFCHASPDDFLNNYVYPNTDLKTYDTIPYDIVFMGHTHRQFLRQEKNKTFCNVGSIGLPRDNGSLMGFAILDTDTLNVLLYRKKIDIETVVQTYGSFVNEKLIELMNRTETLNYPYTLLDGQN
jgi:putative phosphoesterase